MTVATASHPPHGQHLKRVVAAFSSQTSRGSGSTPPGTRPVGALCRSTQRAPVSICAELRQGCRIGHPLGDKVHDGGWWIAAAAIRLGLPLESHDGVFAGAPRLEFVTAAPWT